jgi:hypothetical protein
MRLFRRLTRLLVSITISTLQTHVRFASKPTNLWRTTDYNEHPIHYEFPFARLSHGPPQGLGLAARQPLFCSLRKQAETSIDLAIDPHLCLVLQLGTTEQCVRTCYFDNRRRVYKKK